MSSKEEIIESKDKDINVENEKMEVKDNVIENKKMTLPLPEPPIEHIPQFNRIGNDDNNDSYIHQNNSYNHQNQPERFHYQQPNLAKRNFWTNGLSVNETRISALVVSFIGVIIFALFMYAKRGDISPTLASIIQWIVMGIAGINIGGMVGGMFGTTNTFGGSSMYGGMYGSFGTYSNNTMSNNTMGYNNTNYNTNSNQLQATHASTPAIPSTTNNAGNVGNAGSTNGAQG